MLWFGSGLPLPHASRTVVFQHHLFHCPDLARDRQVFMYSVGEKRLNFFVTSFVISLWQMRFSYSVKLD